MIDGLPLSFFLPLVVHALAGLATVVTGAITFITTRHPVRHSRWGARYLWAYTVVFFTAILLSVQHWPMDAYLLALATIGYGLALVGYGVRRYHQAPWAMRLFGEWWVIAHLASMIGSYVVLLTAFYVDNAHLIPLLQDLPIIVFWIGPTLIALPFLARAIARFAPKRKAKPMGA